MSDERAVIALRALRLQAARDDRVLQGLVGLAVGMDKAWLGLHLTLLVDGTLVRGRTTTELEAGKRLDAILKGGLDTATFDDESVRQTIVDFFEGYFEKHIIEQAETDASVLKSMDESPELVDRMLEDFTLLDPDVAVSFLRAIAPRNSIMLSDTQILIGNTWLPVGDFRIEVAHIGGWWISAQDA